MWIQFNEKLQGPVFLYNPFVFEKALKKKKKKSIQKLFQIIN